VIAVEVRLYATLADRVPGSRAGDAHQVNLEEAASLSDLFRKMNVQTNDVHLVIVNGRVVHDSNARLTSGDRVALFPPVGGG
jgi:molybdopterin synthase sulfur carrier subunit